MNCSKCGTQNSIDAKNCINCGQPLIVNQPQTQPTTTPAPVQQPVETAPAQPVVSSTPNQVENAGFSVAQPITNENVIQPVSIATPTPIEVNQIPTSATGNNVTATPIQKEKKKIGKLPIIIAAILLVCVIVLVAILLLKGEKVNAPVDKNDTTAFFLRDSDYNYILFNEDGEQLSEK